MAISEITEEREDDDDGAEEQEQETPSLPIDAETQTRRIRQIIEYQKSLYWSSSSSLSTSSSAAAAAAASRSSLSSSRRSSSLMELMKSGSTSLRRLFGMEHTSLADYLDEYSATPVVKTVPLWGSSDSDADRFPDPWDSFKSFKATGHYESARRNKPGSCGLSEFASRGTSFVEERKKNKRKLKRKRSFRRLPGFGTWRWRGFRLGLRLRRLRIMICGRKF
ncbi:hypothetical protein BT93_D1041 [Corymbia citriodora subsp. variegata]|nr:hypothetical protein BT93_D1041 [Corymbia citriodora subsp. variegata]